MLRLPWQRPLPSHGALNILQLWASGGRTREPILTKFGTQQQVRAIMTVTWSNIKFLKFKITDGRHFGKYSKCHNSPTNGPTVTQLGWSHPIMFSTCPPWCGLRLPRQRPLPSNGALNILQLWASGGRTREPILMKFGTQQHLRTTMTVTWSNIEIYKIQNDGRPRHVGKYWKYHNSPTNGPIGTKLGWPHPITFPTCPP